MTLKQIDTRIALFPEYLTYRLDHWMSLPFGRIHTLETMGMIFAYEIMTYDQWLYQNGHEDLIDYA